MIPAGIVNALVAWAKDSSESQTSTQRIALIKAERDALISPLLSGGKDRKTIQTATLNGKSFAVLVSLSVEEKLTVLHQVLVSVGEADETPCAVYANFSEMER